MAMNIGLRNTVLAGLAVYALALLLVMPLRPTGTASERTSE